MSQSQSSRSTLWRDSDSDSREVDNVYFRYAVKIASTSTGLDDDDDYDSKTKNKNTGVVGVAIDKTASVIAAIAESKALYESLKTEYIAAGCVETWGAFPTPDSTEITINSQTMDRRKVCTCGLIHDMAASRVLSMEEEKIATSLVDGTRKFDDVTKSAFEFASTSTSTSKSESKERASMTKLDSWVAARTANSRTKCIDKKAGDFACQNIDLVSHMPLNSFKTTNTDRAPYAANDVWGWTSRDGNDREFVIWGVKEGHYFVEVFKDDSDPFVVGFLPETSGGDYAYQHDAKVVGDYVYIGAESSDHGIQIFDMRRLLDINTNSDCDDGDSSGYCKNLTPDTLYFGPSGVDRVGNTHNIVSNDDNPDFVYLVGGSHCSGGLHIVDVSNPKKPTFVTCFEDDGYIHDAQCVNYKGPDTRFSGREICFCYNEDSVTIVDVTNKSNPSGVSITGYNKSEYTHQGWISSDHTHIVFGDEDDELEAAFTKTRTMVLNVKDLTNPNNFQEYAGPTGAIDHNQYVVKATAEGQIPDADARYRNTDLIYQANFAAGLKILQVLDYETANFKEIAYFDTYPYNDNTDFQGAWSSYPYFKSGVIAISNVFEGLFLVRPNLEAALVEIDPIPKVKHRKKTKKKKNS